MTSSLIASTSSRQSIALVPRLHLIEIAESSWCPTVIRDGVTDFLQHVTDRTRPYAGVVPLLTEVAGAQGSRRYVDLGAGAGGPWRALSSALGADTQVRLTDAHPNLAAFAKMQRDTNDRVLGEPAAMRAEEVPATWAGTRTMFSAFHHLTPVEAVALLRRTIESGHSIAIFEATRRHPTAILLTLLTPLLVLLMTPAISPFRWSRLVFTYLIPLLPLTVLFDGIVSCLRTWSPEELLNLAREAAPHGVRWSSGAITGTPIPVTYLVGVPVEG